MASSCVVVGQVKRKVWEGLEKEREKYGLFVTEYDVLHTEYKSTKDLYEQTLMELEETRKEWNYHLPEKYFWMFPSLNDLEDKKEYLKARLIAIAASISALEQGDCANQYSQKD